MTLPTLYKQTKNCKIQMCKISTIKDVIEVEYGYTDGKKQFQHTTCTPKNIGRANATTATEQAEAEATAMYKAKQERSGYSLGINTTEVKPPLAMKIKVWEEGVLPAKTEFPFFLSEKYNGINGTYVRSTAQTPNDTLTLYSRTGTEYPPVPHLEESINLLMDYLKCNSLNGELFIHNTSLQQISSAVKKPKELSTSLTFRVFNVPDFIGHYDRLHEILETARKDNIMSPSAPVQIIKSTKVNSHGEINLLNLIALKAGMEGTVIYHPEARYQAGYRSNRIWKLKPTLDAEALVTGMQLDKNNHPVYTCKTLEGGTFKVKRKGTNQGRLLDGQQDNIGRYLTYEYECLSDSNIPLKPVGLNFREEEDIAFN